MDVASGRSWPSVSMGRDDQRVSVFPGIEAYLHRAMGSQQALGAFVCNNLHSARYKSSAHIVYISGRIHLLRGASLDSRV